MSVQCVWKKDQKRVESKSNPLIGGKNVTQTSFNGETLSLISTIQRGKDGNFTEKTSHLVIKIVKSDKSRSVGQVTINLSNYTESQSKTKYSIEKCPDKNAFIEITVKSKLINAVTGSDTMSMMSGFENFDNMSIDSGPDSEFNFKELEKNDEEEKGP